MTWFSSGLSNLKEQFNSLINDDDDIGNNLVTHTEPLSPEAGNKVVTSSQNFKHDSEIDLQDEVLSRTHRYQIVKYSKTLKHLVYDANFLNGALNEVVENVARYMDENESLRREVVDTGICDSRQETSSANASLSTNSTRAECVAACPEVKMAEKIDCEETFENPSQHCRETQKIGDKQTTNKETQTVATTAPSTAGDDCRQQPPVVDRAKLAEDEEIAEFTQRIENLIIETDEISEKLNCMGKSWQKMSNDGGACVTMPTDEFIEYVLLVSRRDALWEKLKVSFVWPTVAKFKNTEISELSVPDSIKEVFQPGYVAPSDANVDTDADAKQALTQLTSSKASVDQSRDERDAISTSHHQLLCSENADHSTVATVQNSEKVVHIEKNKPPDTSAAVVEVERLRKHLISVEQAYTNELLQCEEEIQILRSELKNKVEKLNSITESYTRMNLSTNKTIEQLRDEIKQLANDKVQLTTQLGHCQNDLEKYLVDSHNLRSALDLFYKNKDSEIVQVTEKLNSRIRMLQSDNERLRETLTSLQNDVDSSQQVTKQNEILSEELRKLKNKVDELSQQQQSTADKGDHDFSTGAGATTTATLDVEAKMRLYISSDSPTTKSQSLRILADVLEFSDYEKMKIGLQGKEETGRKTAAANNQSLIDEFIRFVEKESHPHIKLAETRQQMRKTTSTTGSTDLSPVDNHTVTTATTKTNTSINLPAHNIASSSSILLKDALNSNDI